MVLTRAMRQRRAADGSFAGGADCAELPVNAWGVVAQQLGGSDGATWRGLLRGLCRAARDGGDGVAPAAEDGRRID